MRRLVNGDASIAFDTLRPETTNALEKSVGEVFTEQKE